MLTLILITIVASTDDDRQLVAAWFTRDASKWRETERRCDQLAVMFSDAAWLSLTLATAREIEGPRECVAIWYWSRANETRRLECAPEVPCFTDHRASDTSVWGTGAYFNKIAHRMTIMVSVLDHLGDDGGKSVALIDSDVAFLRRRPLVRMSRLAPNATMVVQQEWPCTTAPLRPCANAGVWLVRRNAEGRRLLGRVTTLMRALALPDQDALEATLAESDAPSAYFLDRAKFANGYTVQTNATWSRAAAHMVHANWLPNLEAKRDFLAKFRRAKVNA